MRLFYNAFVSEGYSPHIRSRESSSVNMIQLLKQNHESLPDRGFLHLLFNFAGLRRNRCPDLLTLSAPDASMPLRSTNLRCYRWDIPA